MHSTTNNPNNPVGHITESRHSQQAIGENTIGQTKAIHDPATSDAGGGSTFDPSLGAKSPEQLQAEANEPVREFTIDALRSTVDFLKSAAERDEMSRDALLSTLKHVIGQIHPDDIKQVTGTLLEPLLGYRSQGGICGMAWEQIESFIDDATAEAEEEDNPFEFLSWDEVEALPDPEWMVDDIIGHNEVGIIYGASTAGKTFVTIDLMLSAMEGTPFANRFNIDNPLKVLYTASEGSTGIKARIQAAKAERGLSSLPNFCMSRAVPQLFDSGAKFNVNKFIESAPDVDLVIIDTLHSAFVGGEENSSKDVGVLVNNAKRIASEMDCSVLIIHHTGKSGDYRGSSSMMGDVDTMLEIQEKHGRRTLNFVKVKEAKRWDSQAFELVDSNVNDSAYVQWGDVVGDIIQTKKTTDQAKIKNLLKNKLGPEHAMRYKWIAEGIGHKSEDQVRKLMIDLVLEDGNGICEKLENPAKKRSPHNPMVYYYDPSKDIGEGISNE